MSEKESTSLRHDKIGFFEVIALSVAILAPTFASSMNFGMIASNAGYGVSLVFVISVVALLLVSTAFVKFGQRVSSAGSVYTYIETGLGKHVGTVSGWALLLTYGCWTAGCSSAFGYLFSQFILEVSGVEIPWIVWTLAALVLIWAITYFDIALSTRLMLVIELVAVVLLLIGIVSIAVQVAGSTGLSAVPFQVDHDYPVTGIGAGMVAAVLSFGGFEGAASLGEESRNPKRYIPVAILSTVIFAGIIYIFVSWVEMNAYGISPEGLEAFQNSGSAVVELCSRFLPGWFTTLITLFISISAFSTALGSMTASSRALYQLGKDGKVARIFGTTHAYHGTPAVADTTIAVITIIVPIVFYAATAGRIDGFMVFQYVGTIGTIALILDYLLTCVAAIAYFGVRRHEWTWQCVLPGIGAVILLYALWSNVAPSALEFPFSVFPYVVLAFLVAGYVVTRIECRRNGVSMKADPDPLD